jgi:hypothetical protein
MYTLGAVFLMYVFPWEAGYVYVRHLGRNYSTSDGRLKERRSSHALKRRGGQTLQRNAEAVVMRCGERACSVSASVMYIVEINA